MNTASAAPSKQWKRTAGLLLAAGLVLRAVLAYLPRNADDDTEVYAELGRNLLHHGTYGMMVEGDLSPSLFRLPGYPLVLGLLGEHMLLVQMVQIFFDLLGCLLLGLMVRRFCGDRAGLWTLGLGAGCWFTSIYSATGMTESLTVSMIALALWSMGRFVADARAYESLNVRGLWPLAAAAAGAMLLRPDGALVTIAAAIAVFWYGLKRTGWRRAAGTAMLFCVLAALPLVPWTVRNAVTFHVFQPLAPRHVNDPGERVNTGIYDWLRTWSYDFVHTGSVYWKVGTEPISVDDLPGIAIDSAAQRSETAALIARYNVRHDLDPALDEGFEGLARERVKADPLRYYGWLPTLRVLDMTMRPRVDATEIPADWARLKAAPLMLMEALALGLLNLFYFGAALAGMMDVRTRRLLPVGILMAIYVVLRCLLLGTIENSEPRYTLEFFPVVFVCAGVWLASVTGRNKVKST